MVWNHWCWLWSNGSLQMGVRSTHLDNGMLSLNSQKLEKHWFAVCRGAGLKNMDLWILMRGPTHSLFSAKVASFHWWISITGPSFDVNSGASQFLNTGFCFLSVFHNHGSHGGKSPVKARAPSPSTDLQGRTSCSKINLGDADASFLWKDLFSRDENGCRNKNGSKMKPFSWQRL